VSTTELIERIKALPRADRARVTEFVEQLTGTTKSQRDARDLAIIERHASRLNREAAQVLEYQVAL
jgi:hypothetical protein